VKLLRVLQDRQYQRVGESATRTTHARIIAATNVDLRGALRHGRMREDLYYRLCVVPIEVPPLRDRREDIPPLTLSLLNRVTAQHGLMRRVSPQAILFKTMLTNVRLFENTVQQLQSATDFIQDAQPILRDGMSRIVAMNQSLQEKGYFQAAAAGLRVGDAMIRSHSAEDWQQVETSIPQLIGLLRELTRPEVLQALEAIVHGFGRVQATMDVNKSILTIVRDLNSADARRGVAILVEFLKVVGSHAAPAGRGESPTSLR
jgi:transcriptional regulator with GAF, ATPase, and Fis domain